MELNHSLTADGLYLGRLKVTIEDTDTVESLEAKIVDAAGGDGIPIKDDEEPRRLAQEIYDRVFDAEGNARPEAYEQLDS